jgi:lipoprotein-anchoring transpeptidase ErfK/SrfK
MFWYIKYPLIIILTIAFLGLSGLIWRSCLQTIPEKNETEQAELKKPDTSEKVPKNSVSEAEPDLSVQVEQKSTRLENLLVNAETQLSLNKLEAARLLAHNALNEPSVKEFSREWFRAAEIINEVNSRFMNDGAPCEEKLRYTVRPGDNLTKIAERFYTSVAALKRLNKLQGENPVIHDRQVLSYIKGAWSIKVSKSQFVLILYHNGKLYRIFRVGIGKEDRTPAGTFVINSRIYHPAWTPPGKNIPYGSPENVLGTHWLGIVPIAGTDPTLKGYGIHGTWEPETVGTASSSGCIRLRNEEVEELFDFIPEPGGVAAPVRVLVIE